MAKPTVCEMDEYLKDLLNWERFALHLPKIEQADIDKVKKDNPSGTDAQKQALFDKWLRVHPRASWEDVIQALEKVDESTIAENVSQAMSTNKLQQPNTHEEVIEEGIVTELSNLHQSFSSITFECTGEFEHLVESGEVHLSRLVRRAEQERAYNLGENIRHVENTDHFFRIISQHCHFLNVHLLLTLVLQFLNPSKILQKLRSYEERIQIFKKNTKIRSLHKRLKPYMTKSAQEVSVTVQVQNAWEEHEMWLVEVLLQTLFRLNSLKWISVVPGSTIIVLLVPQHISLSVIEHSKHKIQFMRLTGIFSLQIGDTYVLEGEENISYSFEESLIDATEAGNYEAVQFLLHKIHIDINTLTQVSPESMVKVKEEAINIYTDQNGNNYFKRDASTTALMTACCIHEAGLVELLIKNNANVDLQTNTGWTALMYAAVLGSSRIVNQLLKHNADVNITSFSNGKSALAFACLAGNAQIVDALIKKSADVNAKDHDGETPLIAASRNGNLPVVKILLAAKADPNISKNTGATPLYVASYNGHLQVVEQLLFMKAKINTPMNVRAAPLIAASYCGHLHVVVTLLHAGADPNISMKNGTTPLFIASQNGHLQIVEQLLLMKAKPNVPRDDGVTSLLIASNCGHLHVVQTLLHAGADPNISRNDGTTPLHLASQNGYLQIVEQLLFKANPNVPQDDGATPLLNACDQGHLQVVETLLHAGADPTISRNDGTMPLDIACQNGQPQIVELLLMKAEQKNDNVPQDNRATPFLTRLLRRFKK